MSNPYFSVGEEVILCSKSEPHLNGDHVIEGVLNHGVQDNPYSEGRTVDVTSRYGYKLVGLEADAAVNDSGIFKEPALRKKHKPSTDSFTEMMSNINELVTQ